MAESSVPTSLLDGLPQACWRMHYTEKKVLQIQVLAVKCDFLCVCYLSTVVLTSSCAGVNYVHQFCVGAAKGVLSPFVLQEIIMEALQRLNPAHVHNHLRTPAFHQLVQRCQQAYMQVKCGLSSCLAGAVCVCMCRGEGALGTGNWRGAFPDASFSLSRDWNRYHLPVLGLHVKELLVLLLPRPSTSCALPQRLGLIVCLPHSKCWTFFAMFSSPLSTPVPSPSFLLSLLAVLLTNPWQGWLLCQCWHQQWKWLAQLPVQISQTLLKPVFQWASQNIKAACSLKQCNQDTSHRPASLD